MSKYITVNVGKIITQIAKPTEIKGYTQGVIECFLPDETEWSERKIKEWIKENNIRMEAVCKFLNDNDL
jgi:hypothetical protein